MRPSVNLVPAFTLIALLPGCIMIWDDDWGQFRAEASEEINVSAAGLLSMSGTTHNGYLDVVPSAGEEVRIVVRKRARGGSQEEADANLAEIVVVHEVRNGQLELGWEWRQEPRRSGPASVSFRIEAPPHLAMELKTHNGRVSVRDWRADFRGETHNGDMDIQGVFGQLELVTHNGNITASLTGSGPVSGNIETHNGGVDVRVGDGISARVVASTHNGGVSYSGELDRVEAGRNFMVGDFGDGSGRLRITTHNGSVRVR